MAAAVRFFRRLLRRLGDEPKEIVPDALRNHGVAHTDLMSHTIHSTKQKANNWAEHYRYLRMSAFGESTRIMA